MRASFPLFQSHLDLAHAHWRRLVSPGDCVIDATCGNGHDSLELAKLALKEDAGFLYVMDIQEAAIALTRARLLQQCEASVYARVAFFEQCHSHFPAEIKPHSVKLIVYNLGYLPGGNKERTTRVETTLASLESAFNLLAEGGCISITAYPGHPEGAREEEALLTFFATLDPASWSCSHQRWLNRSASPTLILLQKANPRLAHSSE